MGKGGPEADIRVNRAAARTQTRPLGGLVLRRLTKRISQDQGFTLIELLVVILIIGILAAIALPAFLGQRQKAQDSEAKTAVRTAATAMKAFYTDNQTYVGATTTELQKIEPSLAQGQGSTLTITSPTVNSYTVDVTSKTGNHFKVVEASTGVATRTCTTASNAGCPSGGSW
jgi:type IV pilus assembly protein PilA